MSSRLERRKGLQKEINSSTFTFGSLILYIPKGPPPPFFIAVSHQRRLEPLSEWGTKEVCQNSKTVFCRHINKNNTLWSQMLAKFYCWTTLITKYMKACKPKRLSPDKVSKQNLSQGWGSRRAGSKKAPPCSLIRLRQISNLSKSQNSSSCHPEAQREGSTKQSWELVFLKSARPSTAQTRRK